jgi:NADH:ubiquinone oxidoreductase subunit 5 (subunit L)/multisubunit Na+/H+ antiporter MnhA subunit
MPKFAAFIVLFSMANCGLPATSGFVGEFMVILGAVQFNFWIGLLAATALILGAAYSLWMVKRVVFGKIGNKHVAELTDLNGANSSCWACWRSPSVHGPVSGAVHRHDANLGGRPAAARLGQQAAALQTEITI